MENNMTTIEKIADSIGQCIFRIEANAGFVRKQVTGIMPSSKLTLILNGMDDIQSDLEKLKGLKSELLSMETPK